MNPVRQQIEHHLHETLGVTATLRPWGGDKNLPIFLKQGYEFAELNLLDRPTLAVIDLDLGEFSPATIRKHIDLLQEKFRGDIIYVRSLMAGYQRKRLIEQRVSFLAPGKQLYLPTFGIDLREFYRQPREANLFVAPLTQLVLIKLLMSPDIVEVTPNEFAKTLGYSKMSMGRAFLELELAHIAEVQTVGRNRILKLDNDRKKVWEQALPLLRSPVIAQHPVDLKRVPEDVAIAGLSALANYSQISAGAKKVCALSQSQWKTLAKELGATAMMTGRNDKSDGDTIVEVWSYDPLLLASDTSLSGKRIVDRMSLYLSLRSDPDERVEAALEELMKGVTW